MRDEEFIKKYEELLDKGYCNCNEMNCIDNNTPRRILNVVKNLQQENQELKNQQKEFIEWLEKEIQRQEDYAVSLGLTIDYDIAEYTSGKIDALKESLSKYKEIIGGKK